MPSGSARLSFDSTDSTWNGTPFFCRQRMPATVLSKVPLPLRVLRLRSWISRGPSMLTPMPTFHSRNSRHQSSFTSVPLVWKECFTLTDDGRSRSMVAKASR